MSAEDQFKKIISHAKEFGFVFPNSEIYDGLSATYDYGQNNLSAHLLKNYHRYLWKTSIETLKQQTQVIPCLAGKSHMVVWGDGRVASCEMLPEVGNLKEKPLSQILESQELKEQVKSINNKKCHCTHNCAMITSVLYNPT